jgi:ABC-type amino acid transport substrate-binding protein
VINVGLEGTYPPFSFVDADGKLTGFEVEFSEALARRLGVKAKFNRPSGTASSLRWNPSVWTP